MKGRLLQIVVEGNTGSTGTIAEAIGKIVIKEGWDSIIAHGRFPRPSESKIIRIGTDIDVFIHGIETRIFDRHGLGSRIATKKLINWIEEARPEIIHLHHLHGYYINIKLLFQYLQKTNIPVVWTFHDCWAITGHCCHFDFVGCDRWKYCCYQCPQKGEYPASLLFDRSRRNYRQKKELFTLLQNLVIVSVSNWLDSIVAESFLKGVRHICIYNGIDTDVFRPSVFGASAFRSKNNLEERFIILGVASNWGKRKGLEDFVNLSQRLKDGEVIVLVGLTTRQIKRLPKNIIGLKKTENKQELIDLYSSADVFLNLSFEETFGLTTTEAMACGTPSIVYNVTACPEVIDENSGIVVEKGNIDELLTGIYRIKAIGKKAFSKECRERVMKNFNQTEQFKKYLALYRELLSKSTS